MSSGSHGFERAPRWSGSRRAAVVAVSAVALSGTAIAMAASTFASSTAANPGDKVITAAATTSKLAIIEAPAERISDSRLTRLAAEEADETPIATVSVAGADIEVPDVGVPLPKAAIDAEELGLPLPVVVETSPDEAAAAEEPKPSGRSEPAARQMGPHTAVNASQPPVRPLRTSGQLVQTSVDTADDSATIPDEQRAVIRAVGILAQEKSAPLSRSGLGLVAPFAGTSPEASGSRDTVQTLDLATRLGGPTSATGDWDLMPEVGFAAFPLALAAMLVIAHGRRTARAAAAPERRKHASS